MAYAAGTTVPVRKTQAEIEDLVTKYGARSYQTGWVRDSTAGVTFEVHGRMVRMELPLPTLEEAREVLGRRRGARVTEGTKARWVDYEGRRRWRALLLAIKGKLVTVASGISTFEQEFLAHIVTHGNLTLYEALLEQQRGAGVPLLTAAVGTQSQEAYTSEPPTYEPPRRKL